MPRPKLPPVDREELPDPDLTRKLRYTPLDAMGIKVGWASDRMFTLCEGDFLQYRYKDSSAENGETDLHFGRALALALTDGAGDKLDPPHLAVFELGSDMTQCFLRLVHPNRVYAVLTKGVAFGEWFFGTTDFCWEKLELLLRLEHYGALNCRFLNFEGSAGKSDATVDGFAQISPPRNFAAQRSCYVPERWVTYLENQFEIWLKARRFERAKAGDEGQSAEAMVGYFLQETLHLAGEEERVYQLARAIGKVKKCSESEPRN